jgi:hypothetical protein
LVSLYFITFGSKGDPKEKNTGYTSWLWNDYCLMEHDDKLLYVPICVTFGYLLYDIILIYRKLHDDSDAGKQIYMHHVIGIMSGLILIWFGPGGPINLCVSLLS